MDWLLLFIVLCCNNTQTEWLSAVGSHLLKCPWFQRLVGHVITLTILFNIKIMAFLKVDGQWVFDRQMSPLTGRLRRDHSNVAGIHLYFSACDGYLYPHRYSNYHSIASQSNWQGQILDPIQADSETNHVGEASLSEHGPDCWQWM